MALPTISEIGRVTADTELRYTNSGKAVASTRLAFNRSRKNDQTGQWETVNTFFVDATTWEHAAERASQTLMKGTKVFVTGELETQSWEQDGAKRSKPSLNVRRFEVIPTEPYTVQTPPAATTPGAWTQQTPQQTQQAASTGWSDGAWDTTTSDTPPF